MEWDVIEVQVEPPLSLSVRFVDGTHGYVHFKPSHLTGVFERLKDPLLFKQVHIEHGALVWPGDLDIAPDAMYDAIKANGEWVLC